MMIIQQKIIIEMKSSGWLYETDVHLTCLKYWSGLVLNRLPSVAEISASKMMPWLVPTRMGPVLISLPSSLFQPTLSMRWPRQRDRLRTFCVFLLRYRHSLVLRLMSRWEPAGREGERHDGGHGFCCSYESRGPKPSWRVDMASQEAGFMTWLFQHTLWRVREGIQEANRKLFIFWIGLMAGWGGRTVNGCNQHFFRRQSGCQTQLSTRKVSCYQRPLPYYCLKDGSKRGLEKVGIILHV